MNEAVIEPYYQAIYGPDGGVAGYEVLARILDNGLWKSAASMIVQLEQKDESFGFDMIIMQKVLAHVSSHCIESQFLTINTSVVTLEHEGYVEQVGEFLASYNKIKGIKPKLYIEVTETAQVQNLENLSSILRDISGLGLGIILDDIGSGVDCLSLMLSVEKVSFVKFSKEITEIACSNPRSLALLRDFVDLAVKNQINVICEGVETEAQMKSIGALCADMYMQGWFFSKAVCIDEFVSKCGCH
jgi:EAL domain-containing protein (putative c-di-GMP-specific phosphodiesterase class I)